MKSKVAQNGWNYRIEGFLWSCSSPWIIHCRELSKKPISETIPSPNLKCITLQSGHLQESKIPIGYSPGFCLPQSHFQATVCSQLQNHWFDTSHLSCCSDCVAKLTFYNMILNMLAVWLHGVAIQVEWNNSMKQWAQIFYWNNYCSVESHFIVSV